MTKASVKPALNRIEKKLDEMKEMIETNGNSIENENESSSPNESSSIEMTCCDNTKKEMERDG